MNDELYEKGMEIRKAVVGAEHVEKSLASADDFNMPMQRLVTEYCWGAVWGREELPKKTRSMLNIAMLAVLNVSSGRNTATGDKFPNRVATGTFDAGFATALMSKDVALYREQVGRAGTPDSVADVVSRLWRETETTLPGSDFTEIYRYLADR